MAAPKYGRATDHNRGDIVDALVKAGWQVRDIEVPLDLLIWKGPVLGLIEIKNPNNPDAKLTGSQELFMLNPPRNVAIVWSDIEAIRAAELFT